MSPYLFTECVNVVVPKYYPCSTPWNQWMSHDMAKHSLQMWSHLILTRSLSWIMWAYGPYQRDSGVESEEKAMWYWKQRWSCLLQPRSKGPQAKEQIKVAPRNQKGQGHRFSPQNLQREAALLSDCRLLTSTLHMNVFALF